MGRKFLLLIMLVAVSTDMIGCKSALLDMKRDSEMREVRIQEKEGELENLQVQQTELREKQARLQSDLRKKQMDCDALSARLDELRRDNSRLNSVTAEQKKEKAAADARLKKYQQELDSLNTSGMTGVQKRKKIKELNKEILRYLDMGLK